MTLASNTIHALAPDAQVLAAGQKLGKPSHWQGLGRQGAVIGGECRGSALYQVRVETVEMGYKCSCPSRKQPCKHVVGLLTLEAEHQGALPDAAPPEWVVEWLARREARAKRAEPRPPADAPPSRRTAAQKERRAEERRARVLEGVEALELWMCDMVRNGLAGVETQPASFWQRQAARLVDAEARGLASWVRRLSAIPGSSPEWPERLLGELGRIELLIQAYRRIEGHDESDPCMLLQHDVRALVGWHLRKEEVSALGEHVTDAWVAVGQVIEEEEQLRTQRTWLRGLRTGRTAIVLQFAAGTPAGFPWIATPGYVQEMELHFWPSVWPQRALIARRLGESTRFEDCCTGYVTIEEMLADVAQALAANPWIDRFLAPLHDVVPMRIGDNEWAIRDRTSATLPLERRSHWHLLARSGGYPIDVHAEWDGTALHSFGLPIPESGT